MQQSCSKALYKRDDSLEGVFKFYYAGRKVLIFCDSLLTYQQRMLRCDSR